MVHRMMLHRHVDRGRHTQTVRVCLRVHIHVPRPGKGIRRNGCGVRRPLGVVNVGLGECWTVFLARLAWPNPEAPSARACHSLGLPSQYFQLVPRLTGGISGCWLRRHGFGDDAQRKVLFPEQLQRIDVQHLLASSRVWWHLSVCPSDGGSDPNANSGIGAWSAAVVSRQLRNWRLPEWGNRRTKHLDFTADFDIEEFGGGNKPESGVFMSLNAHETEEL